MSIMGYFEDRFNSLLKRLDTTTYKIALSIGEDPSRVDKVLFKKKPVTFEKRLETLKKVAESPLVDVGYETMARWLAEDYLPPESFLEAAKEIDPERYARLELQIKEKALQKAKKEREK